MKNQKQIYLIILSIWMSFNIEAANRITIATIGATPPVMDKSIGMESIVDKVIQFWQHEINQVLSDNPDLIVLPELCDRPSGLSPEEQTNYIKTRKNKIVDFFSKVAKNNNCYIAFGTKRESDDGKFYNSTYLLDREGEIVGIYNKYYPTIGEMESGIIPGTSTPVFQCDFGRVAFAICFDLNFDDLRRRYVELEPDIILFSSMYHGGLVQSYWAYSCRSFFVGSIGGKGVPSEIRNPIGQVVASSTNYYNYTVATVNLDYKIVGLGLNRKKLDVLKRKYGNKVTITDPGELSTVLVTSEHDDISVEQMIEEFNIEVVGPYWNRVRKIRNNTINNVKNIN